MQAKHQWMSSLEAARLSLRVLLEVIRFQHVSTSLFSPCRSDNPTNTGQTIGRIREISCLPESNPLCDMKNIEKHQKHAELKPPTKEDCICSWTTCLFADLNVTQSDTLDESNSWPALLTEVVLKPVYIGALWEKLHYILPRLAFPMQTHQWTNKCSNRKDCFVISRLAKPLQVRMKSTTDQLREYRVPHPRWYFRGLSDGMTHHNLLTISFSKYHEQRVNHWNKATDLRNSFLHARAAIASCWNSATISCFWTSTCQGTEVMIHDEN